MGTSIGWRGLQCPIDHLCHLVVLVSARPAWAEIVVWALQDELPVALAPLAKVMSVRPMLLAMVKLVSPAPQAKTIWARTIECGTDRDWTRNWK